MKKVKLIVRVVFGALWVVFAVNAFLQFLPSPAPSEEGMKFLGGLMVNPLFFPVLKITEFIGGVLLLLNVAVPFALILLAPISVNILLYHGVLDPGGLGVAIVLVGLHLFLGAVYFDSFRALFKKV